MAKGQRTPKWGSEHAAAMFRQGLSELRAALYPESNIAQPGQLGLYGTKTSGEIMVDRRPDERDPDEQHLSVLDERLKQAGRDIHGRDREPPEMDRD